ncbi:MAG: AarF/ABC1/UbiB kinase family protein [Myxococcales bacterium]|nr:AarF/ABC1/UbiB kinase family protein [Myxococcales bacterium]
MVEHVKGSRIKRMARFATIAARTTKDVVQAKAMQKLRGDDESAVAESLKPTAARMVEVLGEMKGAATKLGQFIALADQDTFPEEAKRVLNRLLHQTPQRMSAQAAHDVVVRELGEAPEVLFSRWELEPFASASMGQVHGATLHDGTEVVVKLQFPGVDAAIEHDIRNAGIMFKGMSLAGGILDTREYFEEVAETLRRELDYGQEIAQLRAYKEALKPWPDLVVPDVFEELCTERVLVLERLDGPTMLEFAEDASNGAEARFRVASQVVAAIWGPFLRQGLIHADPHPGNYIVLDDGRLGVLDFGATKQLSDPFVLAYWQIVTASIQLQKADYLGIFDEIGFTFPTDREATRVWMDQLVEIVERPLRNDFYDWGACMLTPDCRSHMTKNPMLAMQVRGPVESLMFYRAAVGAAGDFRMLKAAGNFQRVLIDVLKTAHSAMTPELLARLQERGVEVPT